MDARYVVVVEVDNKRALAAYTKGLADLALIWPQLVEHAESVDFKRRAEYEKRQEFKRLKQARRDQDIAAYEKAMKEWEEKAIFRGPMPVYPSSGYGYDIDFPPSYLRSHYESIRSELQNMANLAGAAISAYRMTEGRVHEMVAWEDGSKIEKLKELAASKENLQIPSCI